MISAGRRTWTRPVEQSAANGIKDSIVARIPVANISKWRHCESILILTVSHSNCRPNSVTKHAKSQHGLDIEGSSLHFDKSLGTNEAPKTRRPPAVRGVQQAPKLVPYDLSDEELFKRSEVTREGKMRDLKIDHIRWFGSEAALHASVPNYPPFVPREHPYGRMTSASSMLMDGRSSTFASASPSSLTDLSLDSPHLLTGTIQPSSSSGLLPINEESDHWSFHSESSSNALQHAESWSTAPLFPPMASYSSHPPHPQLPPSSQPIAIPGIHAERIPYGSGDSLDFMLGPMGSPQTLPEQSFDPFTSFLHTTSSVDEETSMLASITSYAAGSFDGSIPPYPR